MSSASSLVTTAASDTSSSADSRYFSGGARRPNFEFTPREASFLPAVQRQRSWSANAAVQTSPSPAQSSRRRSYNLKARGVVIAKDSSAPSGNQKVFCVCKVCKGQRMVSKSTCYRHLRLETEIAEDDVKWDARWGTSVLNAAATSPEEAVGMPGQHGGLLPSMPLGF